MQKAIVIGKIKPNEEFIEPEVCLKMQFTTSQDAYSVIQATADRKKSRSKGSRSRASSTANRREKRVYKCELCGYFHTTSQEDIR